MPDLVNSTGMTLPMSFHSDDLDVVVDAIAGKAAKA